MKRRTFRGRQAVLAIVALWAAALSWPADAADRDDRAFTVANYPVDATAASAVAAKKEAVENGRQAAFRSLIKRLVPATSYNQIEQIKALDARNFLDGMRVRAEENSATQYLATLDFSFSPDRVRSALRDANVPFVDKLAPVSHLVLIYRAPAPGTPGATSAMSDRNGGAQWQQIWTGLDLDHSLAPLKLLNNVPRFAPDALQRLLAADAQAITSLAANYQAKQLVVAYAEPDPQARRLNVTLAGQDAVGRFTLARRYRMEVDDFTYAMELAAVIGQGVLEGRWKARMAPDSTVSGGGAAALEPVQLVCEFTNLGQWQRQQQAIAEVPGVRDVQIGGISGRSATIALRFPGGGPSLQAALQSQGFYLENINGFWIMR